MTSPNSYAEMLEHLYAKTGKPDLRVSYVGGGWYSIRSIASAHNAAGVPKYQRTAIKATINKLSQQSKLEG